MDSRRLAPKRAARRGEAHGWAEQSRPPRKRVLQRSPHVGLFAYLAERELWTNAPVIRRILRLTLRAIGCADVRSGILPPQSTNLPGACWTAAGWPRSAKRVGVRPKDGPNNPDLHANASFNEAPRGAFCVSGGESCGRTLRLFDASCASPFGPSATPMFAMASCLRSRRNCQKQFRTAAGWPWSAKRVGVRPKDGPNNPDLYAIAPANEVRRGFTRCCWKGAL